MLLLPLLPHTHTHGAFMQANNKVWTKELLKQCHDSGLSILLVGTHQPPIRLGAARLIMNSKSMDTPCVFEDCQ